MKGNHHAIGTRSLPDKYLKAHHLEEMDSESEHFIFTIRGTDVTTFPDGRQQLVLWFAEFAEGEKEFGLNKGNAVMCEELLGSEDSDDWVGKKIVLHVETIRNSFLPGGSARRSASFPNRRSSPTGPRRKRTRTAVCL